VLPIDYKDTTADAVLEEFQLTGKWQGEVTHYSKSGDALAILASVATITNKDQKVIGVICTNRDISDRVASEEALMKLNEKLKRSAFHDHLTQLPNRRYLESIFEQHILRRKTQDPWYLVCLDLNGFKGINDTYGHTVGDQLLVRVAKRIKVSIRAEDYAARFGGDEFVLLVATKTEEDIETLLDRLARNISKPVRLVGHSIQVKASIGFVERSRTDNSFESLFRKADKAMYKAKLDKQSIVKYSDFLSFDASSKQDQQEPSEYS
jgi:diguanylate cyclase (GGDEF)-like protein